MEIGDKFDIHCYKHNGQIYQSSADTIILDIKDDYIVCGNYMVEKGKNLVCANNECGHKETM